MSIRQSWAIQLDVWLLYLRVRVRSWVNQKGKRTANSLKPTDSLISKVGGETLWLAKYVNWTCRGRLDKNQRLLKWFSHVAMALDQSTYPALDKDSQILSQPRALLGLGFSSCGQTARLFIDGAMILGFDCRLVQFRNHVAAEVFFEKDWRFFDADLVKSETPFLNGNGLVATLDEILAGKSDLSSKDFKQFNRDGPVDHQFARQNAESSYKMKVGYIVKQRQEGNLGRYFGWNYYTEIKD